MSDDLPPWKEITTDDYGPRNFRDTGGGTDWITSSETIRALLQRQHDGEFRLRLILREAVDLKRGPTVDPNWKGDYRWGPDLVLAVAEICIERKNGRRKRIDNLLTRPKPW